MFKLHFDFEGVWHQLEVLTEGHDCVDLRMKLHRVKVSQKWLADDVLVMKLVWIS